MWILGLMQNPWLAATLVGVFSLCVGSFLNVVIYRMPLMMLQEFDHECKQHVQPEVILPRPPSLTLSQPASRCPSCGHQIRWHENIPLISWLVLRGRCSACQAPIGIRYPLVELGTMVASLIVFYVFGPTVQMLAGLVLTWVLIALIGIDADHQLLPDRLTLPLAALGLAVNSSQIFVTPSAAIWGYVLGFLALWIVYMAFKLVTGKEGMGYGDFKLLAALGAWLGPQMLPLIVLLSSLVGAIIGIILLKITKKNMPFAFGPYLAIAGWIALLWGPSIVHGYLQMSHLN